MALVCPYDGEVLLLEYIVGLTVAGNPVLHLYSNNLVPSDTTEIGNCTEVTIPDYAAITLTSANWTVANDGAVSTASYSEETFAFSERALSYGYYVTDDSNQLLWVERFQADYGFQIPDGGGTISITTKLTLS